MIALPDDDTLRARGEYATLNAARRDAMAALQDHADTARGGLSVAFRIVQREAFDLSAVDDALEAVREAIDSFAASAAALEATSRRLDELRPAAWGR